MRVAGRPRPSASYGYYSRMPFYEHPRAAVTADVVLVSGESSSRQVLLIRRGNEPFADFWALPGGFVDEGELIEHAARRELVEETGVGWAGPLTQTGAYGDPGRDPRGWTISVAWVAYVGPEPIPAEGDDDAAEAAWHSLSSLPELAFDHAQIIEDAIHTLDRGA